MLKDDVYRYVISNKLINPGDKIIAGVSGGADSTCLLLVLCELAEKIGFSIKAVHVNHMIRSDADEDAEFVASLCRKCKVPFQLEYADIPKLTAQTKLTEEEAGRNERYSIFEKIRQQDNADSIAVAHNLDDLAETVLLNLFRGSGLHGAAGIRPRRERIIRPLLNTSRADIEAYLKQKEMHFCTDSTNLEDDHTRNRIRHHIMSYARSNINLKAAEHIASAAFEIAEADDYIRMKAAEAFHECKMAGKSGICLNLDAFIKHPDIIRRNILLLCMEELTPCRKDITQRHIEMLSNLASGTAGSASCNLPYGLKAVREYSRLYIDHNDDIFGKRAGRAFVSESAVQEKRYPLTVEQNHSGSCNVEKEKYSEINTAAKQNHSGSCSVEKEKYSEINTAAKQNHSGSCNVEKEKEPESYSVAVEPNRKGKVELPGIGNIFFQIAPYESEEIPAAPYTKWFDYDKIHTPLIFRHRRAGDYIICDQDSGSRQTIKKYFINEKIPAAERDRLFLLADGNHILWIPGYRVSAFYHITDNTRTVIKFQIGDKDEGKHKGSIFRRGSRPQNQGNGRTDQ